MNCGAGGSGSFRQRTERPPRGGCAAQPKHEATICRLGLRRSNDRVNRVLLWQILGLPLVQYWRLRQDPCGQNVIEVGSEFRVGLLNGTDHLALARAAGKGE
jgi:hypothetical protein